MRPVLQNVMISGDVCFLIWGASFQRENLFLCPNRDSHHRVMVLFFISFGSVASLMFVVFLGARTFHVSSLFSFTLRRQRIFAGLDCGCVVVISFSDLDYSWPFLGL